MHLGISTYTCTFITNNNNNNNNSEQAHTGAWSLIALAWCSPNSVSTRNTEPECLTCRVLRLSFSAGVSTIPKYSRTRQCMCSTCVPLHRSLCRILHADQKKDQLKGQLPLLLEFQFLSSFACFRICCMCFCIYMYWLLLLLLSPRHPILSFICVFTNHHHRSCCCLLLPLSSSSSSFSSFSKPANRSSCMAPG